MNELLMHALHEFLVYLQVEKNLAPRTIKEYRMDLELLMKNLQERNVIQWQQVSYQDLRYFLYYLQHNRNNSATSRARKVSAIRTFFTFLNQEGYIPSNPASRLSKPKLEKKLPLYLTQDDCLRFIHAIKERSSQMHRDLTIILMFLYTGIRLSELTLLDVEHLDLIERTIRIYGKGRKERILPILPPLHDQLSVYLQYRKEILSDQFPSFSPLFFTYRQQTWQRIHKRTVHEIFLKYSKTARVDQKSFSAHKLRHTFATLLFQQGVNLIDLKNLLGHNNLNTTEIYTHTSTKQLQEALSKHPLNLTDKNHN